mmetsp:Transcript_13275/g.39107  ORF Transcript_13275/g.39107 Transcript_13275/m.39107 type:complete len:236 (-) Transcript_13275:380-1087(-)
MVGEDVVHRPAHHGLELSPRDVAVPVRVEGVEELHARGALQQPWPPSRERALKFGRGHVPGAVHVAEGRQELPRESHRLRERIELPPGEHAVLVQVQPAEDLRRNARIVIRVRLERAHHSRVLFRGHAVSRCARGSGGPVAVEAHHVREDGGGEVGALLGPLLQLRGVDLAVVVGVDGSEHLLEAEGHKRRTRVIRCWHGRELLRTHALVAVRVRELKVGPGAVLRRVVIDHTHL